MWRPGNLVTIGKIVYRVMPLEQDSESDFYPCDFCSFGGQLCCCLPAHQVKYDFCINLIPHNCYFQRVSPIIVIK